MNVRSLYPENAIRASVAFLMEAGIRSFPLEMNEVIQFYRRKVKLLSYEAFARKERESPQFILKQCGLDGEVAIVRKREVVEGISFDASVCLILYNPDPKVPRGRRRFTILHEYGHVALGHNNELNSVFSSPDESFCFLVEFSDAPLYPVWEEEANIFSRNALCPAICAKTVLSLYGYTSMHWDLENAKPDNKFAPLLWGYHGTPPPQYVLVNLFDISLTAAVKRLKTLEEDLALSYQCLSDEQIRYLENMTYRLVCRKCRNVTLTPSLFCHHCGGQMFGYVEDPLAPLPEPPLRESHQFAFCPGCGEADYPPDAHFCPTCGHPLLNLCDGKYVFPRTFVPSFGRDFPHYCRSTELYCGQCGAPTRNAFEAPLRKRAWNGIPVPDMNVLIRSQVIYQKKLPVRDLSRPDSCPSCGSRYLSRRLCNDCGELILNMCKDGHENSPNSRYCTTCGKETRFLTKGWLSSYTVDPAFKALFTRND